MDQRIVELYDKYVHGDMPWLSFQQRVVDIAGGEEAAAAILPLIEPNYEWGQQVDPADKRLAVTYVEYPGSSGPVRAYLAKPDNAAGALPGVLVIHENRGLNAHIEDVARRIALLGYVALAPDGLTCVGGASRDQEEALSKFQAADKDTVAADIISAIAYLGDREDCTGKVGALGFCFGGGVALQCAIADPACDAVAVFYGRALPAAQVQRVTVPLLLHYAGNDERINATMPDFFAALNAHDIAYSVHRYPGTEHAFHNNTSRARYNHQAATLAWQRTVSFFAHYLANDDE